jgi:hypothetical protein
MPFQWFELESSNASIPFSSPVDPRCCLQLPQRTRLPNGSGFLFEGYLVTSTNPRSTPVHSYIAFSIMVSWWMSFFFQPSYGLSSFNCLKVVLFARCDLRSYRAKGG